MNAAREEEIFGDALEVPVDARAEFLARACGDDGSLRERVQVLLEGHADAGRLLPGPLPPPGSLVSEQPGDVIGLPAFGSAKAGRYALVEKIGEGGCGVVWRAEQREPVKREVALKVIKLGMDTREVIARFEAERQALARMDHPNIARVFDGAATESGRPYFVMELVRGVPITRYCDEHALGLRERIELFIAVCGAVQHAHQKGIIHRDLKPSNILVAGSESESESESANPSGIKRERGVRPLSLSPSLATPKIIDFGIAKATQGKLTDATLHTSLHAFIGTPAYMSPEQAEPGGSADIDTRTDIYSLGVLLYELLTGDTPLGRAARASANYDELRVKVRTVDPPRPSVRVRLPPPTARPAPHETANGAGAARPGQTSAPPATAAELRGDLDWIVMRCLEKDRDRRYESAANLALDLERHLRDEQVLARPPTASYVLAKTFRRHRVAFAATGAVMSALILGMVASTGQAVRATRAEREQSRLRETAQRAQATEVALRHQAQAQELAARRRAYNADMNRLQQALATDKLVLARELLNRHRPEPGQSDLRDWEWRYLWQFCRTEHDLILGRRPTQVVTLSLSADGKWLAVGENDGGVLSVWNLETREERRVPAGEGYVHGAFSPREPLLAIASSTKSESGLRHGVVLWDFATSRKVGELALEGQCFLPVFSSDGKVLVTSGSGPQNQMTLWRVSDGSKIATYAAPSANVPWSQFAVAPDFSLAALAAVDGMFRVIELASGREKWTGFGGLPGVPVIVFSPDGKTIATGGTLGQPAIGLWEAASGRELGKLEGHRTITWGLAFSPDGKTLASAGADHTVRLWEVRTRTLVQTFRGHTERVDSVVILPDGNTVVTGGGEGVVLKWNRDKARVHTGVTTFAKPRVARWTFTSDAQAIVTVDPSGRVERWTGPQFDRSELLLEVGAIGAAADLPEIETLTRPSLTPPGAGGLLFAESEPRLAVGSTLGKIQIWDWERRELWRELRLPADRVLPIAFLNGGTGLLARAGRMVYEFDLLPNKVKQTWDGPPGRFEVAVAPGGATWLMSFERILVRGPATSQDRSMANFAPVGRVTLSPDGQLLAAPGYPWGPINFWDAKTLQHAGRLPEIEVGPSSVAFSPSGRRLAVASSGKEGLKVWDVELRENVLTLDFPEVRSWRTVFSPDGRLIASHSSEGTLRFWRAPSWAEIEAAEKTPNPP